MSDYCRTDVLRIFGLREHQLRFWERSGLIACTNRYSFQDLGQVRKLRELGALRISAGSIRDAIVAMRAVSGLPDPLLQAGLDAGSRRVGFRHSGLIMEPIAGQYLLDFSGSGQHALAAIAVPVLSQRDREGEAARLFVRAVQNEEAGRLKEARELYEAVLTLSPGYASAAINLGTIFYNQREYARAEQYYRMAAESDPHYALAFFDLGNVLDELKRLPEAIVAYRRAIELEPEYADAHYNLALALERRGQRRSALPHWTTYLRLDPSGPWARHARTQLRKTIAAIGMELVPSGAERGAWGRSPA